MSNSRLCVVAGVELPGLVGQRFPQPNLRQPSINALGEFTVLEHARTRREANERLPSAGGQDLSCLERRSRIACSAVFEQHFAEQFVRRLVERRRPEFHGDVFFGGRGLDKQGQAAAGLALSQ